MVGSSSVENVTINQARQKMLTVSLSICLIKATNDNVFTLLPFSDKSCHDTSVMHFAAFRQTLVLIANQLR